MTPPARAEPSLHELIGDWFATTAGVELDPTLLDRADVATVEDHDRLLADLFTRASRAAYATNPWSKQIGLTLETFLATPAETIRRDVQQLLDAARDVDTSIHADTPPLPASGDLRAVASARATLADAIERTCAAVPAGVRAQASSLDAARVGTMRQRLADAQSALTELDAQSLDRELLAVVRSAIPNVSAIVRSVGAIDAYLASTKKLLGFLAFGAKTDAREAMKPFGLPQPTPPDFGRSCWRSSRA
jgi:hypothetical protein